MTGEFKCLTVCGQGLKRNLAGECEDINECLDDPFICTGDNQVNNRLGVSLLNYNY